MSLPAELADLLDNARAEAKRAGHRLVRPIHLAIALYRRDAKRMELSLGPNLHQELDAAMAAEPSTPGVAIEDDQETTALLDRVVAAPDLWAALIAELVRAVPQLRSSTPPIISPDAVADSRVRDIPLPNPTSQTTPNISRLVTSLKANVLGQDRAIAQVAGRLVLTLRGLDVETERPDGVFVFVGPSATGKRSLARCLARELFGSDSALILIDMHEFREPVSITKLIGPLVNLGESEDNWVTSRVLRSPRSVLLFDDAPQAHAEVWESLSHMFDSGKLTDARGKTAAFRSTIIVLTCHTDEEAGQPVGFTPSTPEEDSNQDPAGVFVRNLPQRIRDNIDEIVNFDPLSLPVVESIASVEVAKALDQASRFGYSLTVPDEVIGLLARRGYSPRDGVGHLRANLERYLLQPLVQLEPGAFAAVRNGDDVSLVPA